MVTQPSQQKGSEDIPGALQALDNNLTAYPTMFSNTGTLGGSHSAPIDETQRIVDNALRAVLGGRVRADDPAGLKEALSRSFVEDKVEGRRIYRNVPRGSFADSVGEGEVSGFQGTLMAHARDVSDHALPLLDGLKSLVSEMGEDDVAARVSIAKFTIIGLCDECNRRGGPRPVVIESELGVLLGDSRSTDPDLVGGIIGRIRDDLGLGTKEQPNNVQDEHQLTNYRLLAEYVVGLHTAWENADRILKAGSGRAFISSRLRHLELTMQAIMESVNQTRGIMESVNQGETERKIQRITFNSLGAEMTIEDLFQWADQTVAPHQITLIREGGRIAIAESLAPTAKKILGALDDLTTNPTLPGGLGTSRVAASLQDLKAQWEILASELEELADPVRPADSGNSGAEDTPGGDADNGETS